MKNFVVKYGSIIVNIVAILSLIGLIISTIGVLINQGLMAGIISFWAGITGFVALFFMIFLIMSINEHLAHICEKLNK